MQQASPATDLVVLDLHGTLVADDDDTVARPHVAAFLEALFAHYRVAVWTAGSAQDLEDVLALCFTDTQRTQLAAAWHGVRCTVRHEAVLDAGFQTQRVVVKRLRKLTRALGASIHRTVIVDDTRSTYRENYGNAVRVDTFRVECVDDVELPRALEQVKIKMARACVRGCCG